MMGGMVTLRIGSYRILMRYSVQFNQVDSGKKSKSILFDTPQLKIMNQDAIAQDIEIKFYRTSPLASVFELGSVLGHQVNI